MPAFAAVGLNEGFMVWYLGVLMHVQWLPMRSNLTKQLARHFLTYTGIFENCKFSSSERMLVKCLCAHCLLVCVCVCVCVFGCLDVGVNIDAFDQ